MSRAAYGVVALASLFVCACGSPYPPPNLVDRPRVVAMITDPSVTLPGTEVELRAVLAGAPEGAERSLVWRVCVEGNNPPDALMTPTVPAQDCIEGRLFDVLPETVGATARVRITSRQDEIVRMLQATVPSGAPVELALLNGMRNGLRLVVTARATIAGVEVRASKRVIVSLGLANYPPAYVPEFTLGARHYGPHPTEPDRCVALDASEPALRPGERATLAPSPTVPRGLSTQSYQHFSTSGAFDNAEDTARLSPWTAPSARGETTHWLVAQSGRGSGTGPFTASFAACRFTVPVE